MHEGIDLVLAGELGLQEIPKIEREVPDEIYKLVQDGPLAESLGGFDELQKLRASTQNNEQAFAKLDHGARPGIAPAAPARRSTVDGEPLHKTQIATGAISEWLGKQVALGKTTRQAIAEWKAQFPNHTREVLAAMEEAAAALDA